MGWNFARTQEHGALFTGRSSERRLGDISLCQPKGSSFDTHEYIDIIIGLKQGLRNLLSCWHTEGAQQLARLRYKKKRKDYIRLLRSQV